MQRYKRDAAEQVGYFEGDFVRMRGWLPELGRPCADIRTVSLIGMVPQNCRRTVEVWWISLMLFELLQEITVSRYRDAITCLTSRKGNAA